MKTFISYSCLFEKKLIQFLMSKKLVHMFGKLSSTVGPTI